MADQQQQEQNEEITFLMGLEEGLVGAEELRIESMVDERRQGLDTLLSSSQRIARLKRKKKSTETKKSDEEQVETSIALVRDKLTEQLQALQSVREEVDEERQFDLLRSLFDRSFLILEALMDYGDLEDEDRAAVKSAFLQKLLKLEQKEDMKGVLQELDNLYQDLGDILEAKSPEHRRERYQKAISEYVEKGRPKLREMLLQISREVLNEEDRFSAAEIDEMLKYGTYSGHRQTYAEVIAEHLGEYEQAILKKALIYYEERHFGRSIHHALDQIVERETTALRQIFRNFRDQRYNLEWALGTVPEQAADQLQRKRLKKTAQFLADVMEFDSRQLKTELTALKTAEDVQAFLRDKEATIKEYLLQTDPALTEQRLETMAQNNPFFDLLGLASEQGRFRALKENSERYEDSPAELEKSIDELEELVEGKKHHTNPRKAIRGVEKKITRLMRDMGEQGQLPPPALEERMEALLRKSDHQLRYARSRQLLEKGVNTHSDSDLKKALEAIYADFYQLESVESSQIKKLSKVMSLDHPLTSIRFSAATKEPMNYGGTFILHKLEGKPTSYRQRSQALITAAEELIRHNDYQGLRKLFDQGQLGDRLYMDSIFFPSQYLKNADQREELLYETHRDPQTGQIMHRRINPAIPAAYREYFEVNEPNEQELEEMLDGLPDRLADDEDFGTHFGYDPAELEVLAQYQDALIFHPDGTVTSDPKKLQQINLERVEAVTAAAAARSGAVSENELEKIRLSPARLEKIAERFSPLVALRSAQLGNELAGMIAGGSQHLGRVGKNTALFPLRAGKEALRMYWKDLQWLSPMMIYVATMQAVEHIGNLSEFNTQYGAYQVLSNVFDGTIWGSEFTKLMQNKEDERVNQFKEAFHDFGHQDVVAKLYSARDMFELKAALIEGFETRGVISMDDLLDRRFLKQLNYYTPSKVIPMKYSDEEMQTNPDIRSQMINEHIPAAVDEIWGQGTFLSWVNAGISSFQSKMETARKQAEGDSGPESVRKFANLFKTLCKPGGADELRKQYHPAEILGFIDEDLDKGDNDSWMTYGLLQGLVIERIISNDDFVRVQGEHANDRPMHAILEYQQAINSGMDEAWEECKSRGNYDEYEPFFGFFQGHGNLKLKLAYSDGKWNAPKCSSVEMAQMEKDGEIFHMSVNGSDIQAWREFQPQYHRSMDNSCTALASQYPTTQIIDALREDTAGRIEIRPHDTCAKLRGFQYDICSRVSALEKETDQLAFNRLSAMVYDDLVRLYAFVEHLAKYSSNGAGEPRMMVPTNSDLSPRSYKRTEQDTSKNMSGQTNFQSKISSVAGAHQRVGSQGNETLDKTLLGKGARATNLLRDIKLMSGIQFITGVDRRTGQANGIKENYTFDWSPAEHFPDALGAMLDYMEELADKNGVRCEIADPKYGLRSGDGVDYDKVQTFKKDVAKLI